MASFPGRAWPLATAALFAVVALGTSVADQPASDRAEAPARPSPTPTPSPSASPTPTFTPTPSEEPTLVAPAPTSDRPATTVPGWSIAGGGNHAGTAGPTIRYLVEVEDVLGLDPDVVAAAVDAILGDPRSWAGTGTIQLERVSNGVVRFRIAVASPSTVDRQCLPLRTGGWLSCWNGVRVLLNVDRWTDGASTWGSDVAGYRQYLVNHEVGHALGHDHVRCPRNGELAPVMLQQTKSLSGCRPNAWPHPHAQPTEPLERLSPTVPPTAQTPSPTPSPSPD